jgi:hypothetical protein
VLNVREPGIYDVEDGIDRVIRLLNQRCLYVFDECIGLLDELGRYARELDILGESAEKIKDKETFVFLYKTKWGWSFLYDRNSGNHAQFHRSIIRQSWVRILSRPLPAIEALLLQPSP